MSNFIGPALPPHLQKKLETCGERPQEIQQTEESDHLPSPPSVPGRGEENSDQESEMNLAFSSEISKSEGITKEEMSCIGPCLPPNLKPDTSRSDTGSIGPTLPHLKTDTAPISLALHPYVTEGSSKPMNEDENDSVLVLDTEMSDETKEDRPTNIYGPALPPGLKISSRKSTQDRQKSVLGPSLPPGMKFDSEPEHGSSDSDSDIVGPVPASVASDTSGSGSYIQAQLDERAIRMKRKLANKESEDSGSLKRESWMLELPPDRAAEFGLGPRQFRARAKPETGDRSVWTDTPADRLKKESSKGSKVDAAGELERQAVTERDREMERLVQKHSSKKRKESLLESHQKTLKKKIKKEKKEGKVEERRPFDRNVDLQANRFDEAQKKAIFKKAQLLNDRFSSGQSKFL